jgi:hypothetical protein
VGEPALDPLMPPIPEPRLRTAASHPTRRHARGQSRSGTHPETGPGSPQQTSQLRLSGRLYAEPDHHQPRISETRDRPTQSLPANPTPAGSHRAGRQGSRQAAAHPPLARERDARSTARGFSLRPRHRRGPAGCGDSVIRGHFLAAAARSWQRGSPCARSSRLTQLEIAVVARVPMNKHTPPVLLHQPTRTHRSTGYRLPRGTTSDVAAGGIRAVFTFAPRSSGIVWVDGCCGSFAPPGRRGALVLARARAPWGCDRRQRVRRRSREPGRAGVVGIVTRARRTPWNGCVNASKRIGGRWHSLAVPRSAWNPLDAQYRRAGKEPAPPTAQLERMLPTPTSTDGPLG